MVGFFKANDILSPNQYGFTGGNSTDDAIQQLICEVTNNLNDDIKTIVIFMDLAKAFDTVPHKQLLSVLEHCGVRGVALDVFGSYLSLRPQHTKINNKISSSEIIKTGVPQGTILGPILFITFYKLSLEY